MDASALLTRQGWRGTGHALDISGRGVKKPLLVSRKTDNLGVGKKRVDVHADQWWARAFDAGLKSLDVDSGTGQGKGNVAAGNGAAGEAAKVNGSGQSKTAAKGKVSELALLANGGGKWLGLYDGFVRGEGLEGTIGRDVVEGVVAGKVPSRNMERMEKTEKKKKDKKDKKRKREKATSAEQADVAAISIPDELDVVKTKKKSKKSKKHHEETPDTNMVRQDEEPKKKKKKRKHADAEMSIS